VGIAWGLARWGSSGDHLGRALGLGIELESNWNRTGIELGRVLKVPECKNPLSVEIHPECENSLSVKILPECENLLSVKIQQRAIKPSAGTMKHTNPS